MDKLVDIKDFAQIPDFSLYMFVGILLFGFLVLVFIGLKIYKYFKVKTKSEKQIAKEMLENLDFSNAKKSAYTISKFAPILVENEASKDLLLKLQPLLAKYKYQKNVPDFSQKDKEKFNTFMKVCNV